MINRLSLLHEVPPSFRVLPEYIAEVSWATTASLSGSRAKAVLFGLLMLLHLFRSMPESYELSGKTERLTWALTFLISTWYIKDPFLKSKIVYVSKHVSKDWPRFASYGIIQTTALP